MENARSWAKRVHLVIGTTGFNKIQLNELSQIAEEYRIRYGFCASISIGINILLVVVKTLAELLPSYDVEITEPP